MRWVVSYPEFLLENPIQEEIRRSGLGRDLFHDFVAILDAEKKSVIEYKEVLRSIGMIPGIGDIAWQELYHSPLRGLVSAIETEDAIARLLALVLRIGTLVYNPSILKAVNSREEEIVEALEGRRNPDLARNILGALVMLRSSPWKIKNPDAPKRGKLKTEIVDAILLRTINNIPEVDEIADLVSDNPEKLRTVLEKSIDRLGWPFLRQYLRHIAERRGKRGFWLYALAKSMQPLGSINLAYIFRMTKNEIPIPYQILQGAIGTPEEYILSFDMLEREKLVSGFRSDEIQLETSIQALHIEGHHLENARTGLRLTEAISGEDNLMRILVDTKNEQATEFALSFVKGLLLSPYHPIRVKRAAKEWIKVLEKS
jgi:hypothetical protein